MQACDMYKLLIDSGFQNIAGFKLDHWSFSPLLPNSEVEIIQWDNDFEQQKLEAIATVLSLQGITFFLELKDSNSKYNSAIYIPNKPEWLSNIQKEDV